MHWFIYLCRHCLLSNIICVAIVKCDLILSFRVQLKNKLNLILEFMKLKKVYGTRSKLQHDGVKITNFTKFLKCNGLRKMVSIRDVGCLINLSFSKTI